MKMRFVVKRKAKGRSFQTTIPEEVKSRAEVRAVVEISGGVLGDQA